MWMRGLTVLDHWSADEDQGYVELDQLLKEGWLGAIDQLMRMQGIVELDQLLKEALVRSYWSGCLHPRENNSIVMKCYICRANLIKVPSKLILTTYDKIRFRTFNFRFRVRSADPATLTYPSKRTSIGTREFFWKSLRNSRKLKMLDLQNLEILRNEKWYQQFLLSNNFPAM